ncbi:hypothetical protein PPERSA_09948 [Pseudocohnilembus persalinus]|uniref:Uncharacterized protein n=1 Tax=Pseudocohnilembus persalinus TaxID=266149 RepID=A0A0V0QJH4_PSEPJ|nr:hypothetical protein PPERSA_09948 [Pseudocohnilembus persalinus]|eukprot:KRX02331.1 hypothetical protein PPERSA_09948 [Pseudocohnilembus persalinus]
MLQQQQKKPAKSANIIENFVEYGEIIPLNFYKTDLENFQQEFFINIDSDFQQAYEKDFIKNSIVPRNQDNKTLQISCFSEQSYANFYMEAHAVSEMENYIFGSKKSQYQQEEDVIHFDDVEPSNNDISNNNRKIESYNSQKEKNKQNNKQQYNDDSGRDTDRIQNNNNMIVEQDSFSLQKQYEKNFQQQNQIEEKQIQDKEIKYFSDTRKNIKKGFKTPSLTIEIPPDQK